MLERWNCAHLFIKAGIKPLINYQKVKVRIIASIT
jgi:hypothetical protein